MNTRGGGRNRLASEPSPYLRQHADNPVDWYPWGDESFQKARSEDKPIFLSIGYSTCHWCHVMERESFEDRDVAELMNRVFVSIKVDREERPDIDSLYMDAAQVLRQAGGWPLNVILTPEGKPFFAATYIPKETSAFNTGMLDLIPRIEEAWKRKRRQIEATGQDVLDAIREGSGGKPHPAALDLSGEDDFTFFDSAAERAFTFLSDRFDTAHAGFGTEPKFPQPHNLLFLLRYHRLSGKPKPLRMAEQTLVSMRRGGIYDHLGFGFHRYSTDREWKVPHFEKMLYDQALLVLAYTEAFQATGREGYRRTAEEVLTYLERDMLSPEGGFYSAEDADSEGVEGKYYLWSMAEFEKALEGRDDIAEWAVYYNLEPQGNYTDRVHGIKPGDNILFTGENSPPSPDGETVRKRLFETREHRVRPHLDDKILTDWNGLTIEAFARAGRAFDNPEYIRTAEGCAHFFLEKMKMHDGLLLHRYRLGEAGIPGTLTDYAFFTSGLLELYRATFDLVYLEAAVQLTAYCNEHFLDTVDGGYYLTPAYQEDLPVREKEATDSAIPSGNSVMMENLLILYKMTGTTDYRDRAEDLFRAFGGSIDQYPWGFPMMLAGTMLMPAGGKEILLAGEDTGRFEEAVNGRYLPFSVVIKKSSENAELLARLAPFTADYPADAGKSAAFVCTGFTCGLPAYDLEAFEERLEAQLPPR
jgi:uncharacterized protein